MENRASFSMSVFLSDRDILCVPYITVPLLSLKVLALRTLVLSLCYLRLVCTGLAAARVTVHPDVFLLFTALAHVFDILSRWVCFDASAKVRRSWWQAAVVFRFLVAVVCGSGFRRGKLVRWGLSSHAGSCRMSFAGAVYEFVGDIAMDCGSFSAGGSCRRLEMARCYPLHPLHHPVATVFVAPSVNVVFCLQGTDVSYDVFLGSG